MRAFIAVKIKPTPEIESLISEVEKTGCGNIVEPHNLHVCLEFLGEIDDLRVEKLKKILESAAGSGKFEVKLKNVDAFPNRKMVRVLWIGAESEKLISLADKLKKQLRENGFSTEKFTPHVTIARIKKKMEKDFFSEKEFGSQHVDKVYLIASELTREGPVYSDVYEIAL